MAMAAGVMPGPSSRENGGCASTSGSGLLAYGAASSIVVIDIRSMQLVIVLPMPPPKSSALAAFVTSLEFLPEGISPPLLEFAQPQQQLQLAAGDRQGRIIVWDVPTASPSAILTGNGTVAQISWLHSSSWLLAAIHGTSVVVIWDTHNRSALWKYDAVSFGETLGCVRRDPHDPHQLCVLGNKGLLLSVLVGGTSESDVLTKVYHVGNPGTGGTSRSFVSEERDRSSSSTSTTNGGTSLAPGVRCLFSSVAKGILYIMFAREFFVFDLNFGMTLSSSTIPRGCGKLLDLIADVDGRLLLCAHLDGKLSVWKRKDDSQVFAVVHIDTLMPSAGTAVPAPSVLAATFCPFNFSIYNFELQPKDDPQRLVFVSISDDGRLWHWLLHCENTTKSDINIQLELTGQLHLLPSSVTTMAVPVPSLLATLSGGGNAAAVPVQLVALATQAGTIELFDPSANAVTSSFSVHGNFPVRGVRWLGNSRLVSFSYTEVKGKGGGFINKLAVTCVRSGQSRYFRVLQKPERAPMRALRTSPSGRYMLILFREAPAEVWAMTRNPQMLRSLALPFTVMEWALPAAPKKTEHRPSLAYKERPTIASTVAAANAPGSTNDQDNTSQDDTGESFAFALVNGSLGVFELRGRRVRDFKPKWPVSSFVSPDVLVTAMAYRTPHVVMGDRLGNLRWWDIASGASSWFNTHRGGIKRIKFAPVVPGDSIRGRVAILFNDNTFAVYDLDTQDPLASSFVQPHLAGIFALELDWFPFRQSSQDPLLLCVVAADSSFRVLEIQATSRGSKSGTAGPTLWERQRPMPVYSPALLPLPQALALRMLLQLGVRSSWFSEKSSNGPAISGDLRHHLLETHLPAIGDPVVLELLLKALEPYRKAGRLLDAQTIQTYAAISHRGVAARLAFAAAYFGNHAEAVFWLQLPRALLLLSRGSAGSAVSWNQQVDETTKPHQEESDSQDKFMSAEQATTGLEASYTSSGFGGMVIGDTDAVRAASRERILWHKNIGGDEAVQKLIHEHVAVGDFETAVTLLLATPPENSHFYVDALRAVSLAAAVSPGLHELAVKVVAANMVATDDSLAGTHLLCAVGRYQEACSQLQDAGRWEDASTLAASKLKGVEMARVLQRWAEHVLQSEHNLCKAVTLYVAAGALCDALVALNAQYPDMAAMFLLACHEAKAQVSRVPEEDKLSLQTDDTTESLDLPGNLASSSQEVKAVCEFYGQHQRWLAQLCSESQAA